MPACGQAVGCGVCDTPELWRGARGAAGLCARVRACANAAESLHTYIHMYLHNRAALKGEEVNRKERWIRIISGFCMANLYK